MSLGHRNATRNLEVPMPEHHAPIAQPVGRGETIPVLAVFFDVPVPAKFPGEGPGVDIVRPAQAWYRDQADALVLAMETHCPGGFMDALLGSLLTRKASVFVVPDVVGVADAPTEPPTEPRRVCAFLTLTGEEGCLLSHHAEAEVDLPGARRLLRDVADVLALNLDGDTWKGGGPATLADCLGGGDDGDHT